MRRNDAGKSHGNDVYVDGDAVDVYAYAWETMNNEGTLFRRRLDGRVWNGDPNVYPGILFYENGKGGWVSSKKQLAANSGPVGSATKRFHTFRTKMYRDQ